ncbi:MAG TPA: response regulator [Longimicrobium sp.]|nr:response regulator [Longimicrobium sp.]
MTAAQPDDGVEIRLRPLVLLVEDNEDNQAIYQTILEHGGYDVLQAWDGEEGVRLARERLPAVILMDIAMPRINGWDATRLLRSDPATARIPVLALTAHVLPADRAMAEEIGYDGYLAKPIEPREVLAHVRRVVGTDAPPE